jgi:hypothetical protein
MISLLSSAFVFFLASIVFAVLFMIPSTKLISWISFIYAIPISGIILLILNIKWKDILSQIQMLLKEGRTTQCYQEIYLNINDLQIYPLPEEIKEQVDKAVQTLAFSITDEFYKIN